ncbi:MAG: tripartite tricarboxylate transporter substrate-binding protein [Burkholderiales bacterium]|nr:tripartite tricarboxylate transporter substrate-binding protein [Burkholderiales bacterium]
MRRVCIAACRTTRSRTSAPVSLLHRLPNVLIVSNDLPVASVAELIAYAKARPGVLTFASAGNGSVSHLAGELFKAATGVDMQHIPYKGGGAAMPDVIAGRVPVMFETATSALAAAKGGKVRALAVTSAERWPGVAELPTIAEAGVAGYRVDSWTGLLAPAGTARAIVDRLSTELAAAAKAPAYRQHMQRLGVEAISSTPEEFRRFMQAEIEQWTRAVQQSGAKID